MTNRKNGMKKWFQLVLAVFLPPLFILCAGSIYLLNLKHGEELKKFELQAADRLEQMVLAARTQRYLCESIHEIFQRNGRVDKLKDDLDKFAASRQLKFDYLIWKKNGSVFYSTFSTKKWGGNWKRAYFDLRDFNNKKYASESKVPSKVYENLRRIFGPHFFPRFFYRCYRGSEMQLIFADSSKRKPLLWLKTLRKFGLAVFFDYDILKRYPGIEKMFAEKPDSNLELAAIQGDRVFASSPKVAALVKNNPGLFKHNFKTNQKLGNFYAVSHFIDENLTGVCLIPGKEIEREVISGKILFFAAAAVFIIIVLALYTFKIIVLNHRFSTPLKWQLIMLFVFSNALPGYVIGVIAMDYLHQFRQGLLNQAYSKGMGYLQDIDELFENELTFQKSRLEKGLVGFRKSLSQSGINGQAIRDFLALQQPKPHRFFLVGSSTPYVASNEAVVKGTKLVDLIDPEHLRGPHKKQQLHALEKIGRFFLALLNHTQIPTKMGTEVEMLAETLSQQEPVELMQEFFSRDGGFWNWGIGAKRHPAYLTLLKLFDEELYDYLFIYLWSDNDLQRNFLSRSFANFSRNEKNIKIMAIDDSSRIAMPKELLEDEFLSAFAEKLQEKSTRKLEYCNWQGQQYLLVGLKCNVLTHFRLLGLLPVEGIEREVNAKTRLFLGLFLLSFLITMSSGMFVSGSILEPLSELQKGVESLKKRNFTYRLPDLGNDEFGHLAGIFNSTLVDLEEMHTASIFKEKILSPQLETVTLGNFSVYGRTVAFADAGGDYLEIAGEIGDSVILGDVAGSGIAATLIIAFVKSALIQLEEFWQQPERLVAELDKLLKVSGRKGQRRFMAFQYLLPGKEKIEMVNAGLFFPVLIDRHQRTIRQIDAPSTPLGTGNSSRPVVSFSPESHEILVLFSNGVTASGKIAYEDVFAILQKVDLSSPERLFESFMTKFSSEYSDILDDDVTMVVLMNKDDDERPMHGKAEST